MEGGGRRLPEEGLVFTGEAAEMPEPILGGDSRHRCYVGGAVAQSSPCEMHPAQQQVSLGTPCGVQVILISDEVGEFGSNREREIASIGGSGFRQDSDPLPASGERDTRDGL